MRASAATRRQSPALNAHPRVDLPESTAMTLVITLLHKHWLAERNSGRHGSASSSRPDACCHRHAYRSRRSHSEPIDSHCYGPHWDRETLMSSQKMGHVQTCSTAFTQPKGRPVRKPSQTAAAVL